MAKRESTNSGADPAGSPIVQNFYPPFLSDSLAGNGSLATVPVF